MIWTRDYGLIETLARTSPYVTSWQRAALREGSPGLRSVLAYLASGGRSLYPDVLDGDPSALHVPSAAALAEVMAYQQESDVAGALRLLGSIDEMQLPPSSLTLLAQLLERSDRTEECASLLARSGGRIPTLDRAALNIDLAHPERGGPREYWWSAFCALFTEHGLEPPSLEWLHEAKPATPLFDLLSGTAESRREDGPLITVVLTTFRPDRSLLTATRSILAQSWRPLELIVVDDASGPEHGSVLDEVEAMDERVRLLRLPENQGTYAARNAALREARGEFVTGQDDDDWSHPRRLERQVEPLLEGSATATCAHALRADEQLRLVQPGRATVARLSPTYMARRRDIVRLGGFLSARKGADTELIRRMEATTGSPTKDIKGPLAVYRLRQGSLSRSDFRPGWHHPARAALWSSAAEVHERIARGSLSPAQGLDALAVPARLGGPPGPQRLDVAFAADFGRADLRRLGVLSELAGAVAEDRQVGVIHMSAGSTNARAWTTLDRRVQRMINDGVIHRILLDDDVAVTDLVVLSPAALQFPPTGHHTVRADRGWVIADHAPSDNTLRRVSYVPGECVVSFQELFGVRPTWIARDHLIRSVLAPTMRDTLVADYCIPHSVAVPGKVSARRTRAKLGPVAGKVAHTMADWPDDDAVFAAVYPSQGRETRVLGSASRTMMRLHARAVPADWVVYEAKDISQRSFLRQIDAYVDFPGSLSDAGRARSLALAAGVPVVLPKTLERTYGEAALYAEPRDVDDVLLRITEDRALAAAQAQSSRSFARSALSPVRRPWLRD